MIPMLKAMTTAAAIVLFGVGAVGCAADASKGPEQTGQASEAYVGSLAVAQYDVGKVMTALFTQSMGNPYTNGIPNPYGCTTSNENCNPGASDDYCAGLRVDLVHFWNLINSGAAVINNYGQVTWTVPDPFNGGASVSSLANTYKLDYTAACTNGTCRYLGATEYYCQSDFSCGTGGNQQCNTSKFANDANWCFDPNGNWDVGLYIHPFSGRSCAAAFDPSPAQLTQNLSGGNGASASASDTATGIGVTARQQQGTYASNGSQFSGGEPCSTLNQATGYITAGNITKSGSWAKCACPAGGC